jgi:YD repeat-containing protein
MAMTKAGDSAAGRKWSLTRDAFDRLLAVLHPDRDTAAERYLEMRRNLVRLFEWRGCPTPDEYADETLMRCARKIGEGAEIHDLPSFSIGVGRMVFREMARERGREALPLSESVASLADTRPEPDTDLEKRVECLTRCLDQLPLESRSLILSYYQGERGGKIENRKGIAQLLGVPPNTLRMRALRVREKLQSCVEGCVNRGEVHL